MARQLRIDYAGATHHITSRGNEKRPIFRCNADREKFLELLAEAVRKYGWLLTAWVLMTNHFHLVLETPYEETLSAGMQWLNGEYAQWFNKRYKRSGHLFQGRFHSFLIEKEAYFQEVLRYVVLNPVRAKMVDRPEAYRWSSYRATAGLEDAPAWLSLTTVAPYFGEVETWQKNYETFVAEKIGSTERLWDRVEHQIFLGTEAWMKKMRQLVESKPRPDEHPRAQRSVGHPAMERIVSAVAGAFRVPANAIRYGHGGLAREIVAWLGWYEGWHRLRSIAAALRIDSSGRASNLVRICEAKARKNPPVQKLIDNALARLAA